MFSRKRWYVAAARIPRTSLERARDVGMLAPSPIAIDRDPPRATGAPEVEVVYLVRTRDDAGAALRAYLEAEGIAVYAVRASAVRPIQ